MLPLALLVSSSSASPWSGRLVSSTAKKDQQPPLLDYRAPVLHLLRTAAEQALVALRGIRSAWSLPKPPLNWLRRWLSTLLTATGVAGAFAAVVAVLLLRGMCASLWEAVKLTGSLVLVLLRTLLRFAARGGQPRFPRWTLTFELVRDVMRHVADEFGDRVTRPKVAQTMRAHSEVVGALASPLVCFQHGLALEPFEFRGLEHLWLKPRGSRSSTTRRVVLYFHGGGFAFNSPKAYVPFAARLATAVRCSLGGRRNVDVVVANYRKAPEHPFPAGPEDAEALYRHLVLDRGIKPNQIVIAGDSAGAALALSVMLRVRDAGDVSLPLGAALLSPCVDLSEARLLRDHEAPHCILAHRGVRASFRGYLGSVRGPSTPTKDASAVECDLRGLPPVFVQTAALDLIYAHGKRLVATARRQSGGRCDWELDEHDGVPHVFACFPSFVLPYSQVGVDRAAAFIARRFAS